MFYSSTHGSEMVSVLESVCLGYGFGSPRLPLGPSSVDEQNASSFEKPM